MGAGFYCLPEPYGTILCLALFGFVVVIAPTAEAHAKGFRWWLWAVPNLIGLVAVFLLPSARTPGLTKDQRANRAQYGNLAGAAQSFVALSAMAVGLVRAATGWW